MQIDDARKLCADETIVVTQHFADRMHERGIKYSEVKLAILAGDVIEDYPDDYPDDYPYPSCLILGHGLHVVCGISDGTLWIITAYKPSAEKWESDLKTRKQVQ